MVSKHERMFIISTFFSWAVFVVTKGKVVSPAALWAPRDRGEKKSHPISEADRNGDIS